MPQAIASGAPASGRRPLLVGALIASLLGPSPGWATEPEPDAVPLLRRVPEVAATTREMPAFLRDTDLRLHLRTFYFNQRISGGPGDPVNEAWAGGGSLAYASGWLLDTFQMGATVFTAIPLYSPADRDGTELLLPHQKGFIVPGIAYGALRYKEYALLTGYRQPVEQSYVNPDEGRSMAPNTFEGVTLKGQAGWVDYLVGYLTRMKPRNANDFVSMAEAAGVHGNGGGLVLAGLSLTPASLSPQGRGQGEGWWRSLTMQVSNQFGNDVFNTAYGQVDYTHAFTPALRLTLSGQYTDQRAVGDALLGGSKFENWVTSVGGARVQLQYRDLTLTGAFSVTGKGNNIQTPYGSYPGYLSLLVKDFDRAGEVAWMVGLAYDFSRVLPGMSAEFGFAQGTEAVSPLTRAPEPDQREYDLAIAYRAPTTSALRGFGFRARGGLVDLQGSSRPDYQIRLILDYEIPLL
jgi:hypothetical protein